MPRFAANLSFLFTELDFLDRFTAAADAGFKAVEFMFPYAYKAEEIKARLDDNGLELVLFNLPPGHWDKGERGFAALPDRANEFASAIDLALRYAEALECSKLHVMAGLESHGASRDIFVSNIRLASLWALGNHIDILIEPINTRDMPGYFLSRLDAAREIIAEVGEPNVGLQFDLYHRHIMDGGVEAAIGDYKDITRHYQCASPPDRGEPDKGDLDYPKIFDLIDATGYKGWIGCEYKPRGKTVDGLGWFAKYADPDA